MIGEEIGLMEKMSAAERRAWIEEKIKEGKRVVISTYTRAWIVDKKVSDKATAAGFSLLQIRGNSLYMARGTQFDCIDYCHIYVR